MAENIQTILGSGGAIGTELAGALKSYADRVRLVSRHPAKVNPDDETIAADLLEREAVRKAVSGSSVVYLTAGLPYSAKLWEKQWPVLMSNVIGTCMESGAKLVFFDNIYMYDPDRLNGMTEETPINPCSRKGKVRAGIVRMIMDEADAGRLDALIARSADFYGPVLKNSVLAETVIKPLSTGKKASWMGPLNFRHSYTYTPDAGKATAMLGNAEDAFGSIWHVPTAGSPLTGKEWIETIASELNVRPRYRTLSKSILRMMGLFVPVMKELAEMMYQYDRDYVFDSSKFEKKFDFRPTPYRDGIRKVIDTVRNSNGTDEDGKS